MSFHTEVCSFSCSEYLEYDTEHYCNYPELAKHSRPMYNLRIHSRLPCDCSLDSESSPDVTSCCSSSDDLSHDISDYLDARQKTESTKKLFWTKKENESLSSSETSSVEVLEESESGEEEEEEQSKETDDKTSKPMGWLKYSTVASPWDESKDPLSLKSGLIPVENNSTLTKEMISACSSNIDQLPDTREFVLTRLQLSDKGLKDISQLESYQFYQYIDLSWNEITDISAISTLYLMCLDVSHNKLTNVLQFKPPWFLTYVNLSCNEITEISDLSEFWSIRHLNISYNSIERISGLENLKFLRYLNLSHNHIECVEGLSNLTIEELHLDYNNINSFEEDMEPGLKSMCQLNRLNLSHNQISELHFFDKVHSLRLLDLSDNKITGLLEVDNLNSLKSLHQLNLIGNDITKWPVYREFVLYSLPYLLCLDCMVVSEQEKVAAKTFFSPDIMSSCYHSHAKLNLLNQLSKQHTVCDLVPVDQPPFPLVVFVGPPGCYKRTLASKLASDLSDHVHYCTLYTTQPNILDSDLDYKFVSLDEFNEMTVDSQFLAIADLLGFKYGFCREELCKCIMENKLCLLCLPLEAAFSLKALSLRPHFVLTLISSKVLHIEKLGLKFQTLRPVVKSDVSGSSESKIEKRTSFATSKQICESSEGKSVYTSPVNESSVEQEGEHIDSTLSLDPVTPDLLGDINLTETRLFFDMFSTDEPSNKLKDLEICSSVNTATQDNDIGGTSDIKKTFSKQMYKSSMRKPSETSEFTQMEEEDDRSSVSKLLKKFIYDNDFEPSDDVESESFNFGYVRTAIESSVEQDGEDIDFTLSLDPVTSHLLDKINLRTETKLSCGNTGFIHEDSEWSFSLVETESDSTPEPIVDEAVLAAERSQEHFVAQVLRTSQVYYELHVNRPGLFTDLVYTDNLKEAFKRLEEIIHKIYNDRINWKPCFKVEDDPLYEEMIKPRIDFMMSDLLKTKFPHSK